MEKRLLLAFILSFLVLSVWSAIMPKPPARKITSQENLVIEQEDERTALSINSISGTLSKSQVVSSKSISIEESKILETEKLIVHFSNVGGTLKKVTIRGYDTTLPISNFTHMAGYEDYTFLIEAEGERNIIYTYEDEEQKISKIYEISPDDYIIQSEIKIQNKTEISRVDNINIEMLVIGESRMDNNREKDKNYARDKALHEYVIYSDEGMKRKNKAFKFSSKEREDVVSPVKWVGFRDRYFCALIKPHFDNYGYFINPINDKKLAINVEARDVKIAPGGSVIFASTIYVGPEDLEALKRYDMEFEEIRRYYKLGLFDAISKFIYGVMQMIHKVVPNWGLCIILIGTIVYFSMYPMTMRSMRSMRKMQELQPKLVLLKEKHKNNPQKLNKEMMELYKKNGANPLGGCLPMVFQMPVFIGLYQVLWRSVSFKGAEFLWIKDLSEPDRLFTFPSALPLIGQDFNLLPIIMMVVMFFQQKLTSKNMVVTDPAQKAQQKMMTTFMPLLMGVIFYKFASGLTLYFTMFYLFSTLTQWKTAQTKKVVSNG